MKKSLVAISLVFILLCSALISTLSVGAEEVDTITWQVIGTTNAEAGEYATLQEAMEAAASKTEWAANQALSIKIDGNAGEQTISATNGLLFGVSTIYNADGDKLPVAVSGGTLMLDSEVSGDVLCTNDYSFVDLALNLGDENVDLYAGAGYVTFENVDLGDTAAGLWADPVSAASPAEGALVGFCLSGTEYFGTIGIGGASAQGQNKASLIVTSSYIGNLVLCESGDSAASVELLVENSTVDNILGVSEGKTVNGDLFVTVSADSTVLSMTPVNGGLVEGNVTVTVSGGSVDELLVTDEGSYVSGDVTTIISGGTVGILTGSSAAAENTVNVTGGTIATFYGAAGSSSAKVNNVIAGGSITDFYGTAAGASATTVNNTISGGKITTFYGTGISAQVNAVNNDVSGGAVTAFYGAGGNASVLTNEVAGTAEVTTFYGSGNQTCTSVSTTLSGTANIGTFYGVGGEASTVTNMMAQGGEAVVGAFWGTCDTKVGTVSNTVAGGTITGDFYGAKGSADSATNTFGIKGKHIIVGNATYGTIFCSIEGVVYGTGTGKVDSVVNHLYTNIFSKTSANTLAAACFYGTGAGTVGTVVNNFVAEIQGANQVFSGTSAAAEADITGSVTNTNNGGTGHFNAYSFYPIGGSITGSLVNRFKYAGGRTMPRIASPGASTEVASVINCLENVKNFTGTCDLINYTVMGDVDNTLTMTGTNAITSYLRLRGSVGGNLTNTWSNVAVGVTNDRPVGVYCTVGGNLVNHISDVSYVSTAGSTFALANAQVGGTVTNNLKDFYYDSSAAFCCVNGEVGKTLAEDFTGNAVSTTISMTDGSVKIYDTSTKKIVTAAPAILAEYYGTSVAVHGGVSNTVTGLETLDYVIAGSFRGVYSALVTDTTVAEPLYSITGNVTNGFTYCNFYNEYFGTYQATVDGDVFNTLTHCSVGAGEDSGTDWYTGSFGRTQNVTNTITDSFLEYGRLTSYNKFAYSILGNITNELTRVTVQGACFLTRGSKNTATVESILEDCIFNESIIAINGSCASARTEIRGENTVVTGAVVAWNDGSGVATNELYLLGGTYEKGTAWVSSGKTVPTNPLSKIYLAGDIRISDEATVIATGIADGVGQVTITQTGAWTHDHVYLTGISEAFLAKVTVTGGTAGAWGKRNAEIVGVDICAEAYVNLSVTERIRLNAWLAVDAVDALLARSEGSSLQFAGTLLGNVLKEYELTSDQLTGYKNEAGTFYVLPISYISADDFDEVIGLSGSVSGIEFAFDSAGSDDENNPIPITLLNLALKGSEDYAADTNAANLFKALYNYGASQCSTALLEMEEGFGENVAAQKPVINGSNGDIQFQSMALLMGDAIGIRFKGTLVSSDPAITVKVNGNPTSLFYTAVEDDQITIDLYVNMEKVDELLTFVIDVNGSELLTVETSVRQYAQYIAALRAADDTASEIERNSTLALAQLAQAVINYRLEVS